MENIINRADVIKYLNIPDIPKKKFDGKTSFKQGVAVVSLMQGRFAYAVCTFDAEKDAKPRVIKYFASEPFYDITEVFVVPAYMDTDIENADLDEESKKAAQQLANEVLEMESEGAESERMKRMKELPEWIFDEIHNRDEADAWLRNYNKTNKIKGKLPKSDEAIKTRLISIWSDLNKK